MVDKGYAINILIISAECCLTEINTHKVGH